MGRKPGKMFTRVRLNSTNRKIYRSIRKLLGNQKYRPDLIEVSVVVLIHPMSLVLCLSMLFVKLVPS